MSDDVLSGLPTPPPPVSLLQMMTGYWISQSIYVAAKLNLADRMADGPVGYEELAAATNCHPPTLGRLLRALASAGIFTETTPGHFSLTPLAALLRTSTSDSMHALAITYNEEQYRAWGELLHSVRTGEVAFDHHYGMPVFDFYAQHPETDRVFNDAMTGWTNQLANAVLDSYDFSLFRTVVDVGGGYGTLLAAILRRNSATQGILSDRPHVITGAEDLLLAAGVADRCTHIGGDFFDAVPSGADAYILAQIVHDWDDDRSLAALKRCRLAFPDHGKLLVVEQVLPQGDEPSFGKWLDLHMLVITGGRGRTAPEYDALLRAAGFALTRVVPTPAGASIVEASPI